MNFYLKKRRTRMMPKKPDARMECVGHLRWVSKTLRCCIEGKVMKSTGVVHVCSGRIDPHHVQTVGAGGDDSQVAPLCRTAHNLLDSPWWSQKRFQEEYGVDLHKVAADCWRNDLYHRMRWERDQQQATE